MYLLFEAAVEFVAEGAGDGDRCCADMGAVLADLIDLIDSQGIGAVDTDESVRRETGRNIGQGLMAEVVAISGEDADIVFEAFDIEDAVDLDASMLAVGLQEQSGGGGAGDVGDTGDGAGGAGGIGGVVGGMRVMD